VARQRLTHYLASVFFPNLLSSAMKDFAELFKDICGLSEPHIEDAKSPQFQYPIYRAHVTICGYHWENRCPDPTIGGPEFA